MRTIDTLIYATWIIPIEPRDQIFENYALAIDQGKILDILPAEKASLQYHSEKILRLEDQALLPGFVNAHTHSPMALFRGIANDLTLMEWLNNHVWPAEKKWLSAEFIYDGMQLAVAEMLRSGTTCFNEHYFFPEIMAKAIEDIGIRSCVGFTILDFANKWSTDANEAIAKGLKVYDQYKNHPLISIFFAPHAPYTVSDDTFKKIQQLTAKLNASIHIHVHETADEVTASLNNYHKRPLKRLYELEILSPKTQLVHMTQINAEDLAIVKKTGAHVIHCPKSNLKLASGFFPIKMLQDAGINIGLGTDSAVSNNNLDMIGEMRTAALVAKEVSKNPCTLSAPEALEMATLNGAKALGLEHKIGSLKIGKAADITAINLATLSSSPVYNPIAQIVYSANCNDVTNVWVEGKRLVADGKLTTLDEREILLKAKAWKQKIKNH